MGMNQPCSVARLATIALGIGTSLTAVGQQSGSGLEEVIVTAQRRAESAEDVPISITIASGEALEKAGVTRLEDISLIVPAVQISRTGVYTQPAIRGVTSTLAGSYENNVGIYVDGYYLPFTRGLNTDLVNIEQVQVLKGPQGTLFGRNATGGAILVQTLDPSLTETVGRVNLTFREYNDQMAQAYLSVPLTDTLAWNVAGYYRESDGYIKDVAGFDTAPIENYNVSTKLLWQPTDDLSITAKYETLQLSDGRTLATTYEGRSLVQALQPSTYLETRDDRTSVNFPVENTARQHNGSLKIEYDFGWGRLQSVSSYQREDDSLHYDLDGTAVRFFEQRTKDRNRAYAEDLNLSSNGDGPLQYVVGLYYFDSRLQTLVNESLNGLAANPADRTRYVPSQLNLSETQAYAGYADVTWQVAAKLFLTGGIRYSHETKELTVTNGATGASLFPTALRPDNDETFDSWTPRAVVRYELTDDSNVYASYSRGFKSGFINIAAPAFNVVDPEEIDAYEVGFKRASARWRFDTAAYYYDYKDLQVSSLQIINGQNSALTTNAASAEIYGAEMQVAFEVASDFNVNGAVAYTHARYTDFPNASYNGTTAAGLNTTTACPNPSPPPATILCTQDWGGQRLTRAPDWTGNIGVDYTLQTGLGVFGFGSNVAYSSTYTPLKGDLDANGNLRYDTDDYTLISARASWSPPATEGLTFTAFGENLGNARYYFYRSGNNFGDYHVLAQRRTWGVSVDYRF